MDKLDKYDLISDVNRTLCYNLNNQLEKAIIQGLNKKGFTFANHFELTEFVKRRCRVEDNIIIKQKMYYVDNIPFMLHDYSNDLNFNTTESDRSITISATLGYFKHL